MKTFRIAVLVIVAAVAGAGMAIGSNLQVSVDKGKALFNDPKLGTSGKSCNDCHQNGKGAEKAAGRKDLESVVNSCITQGLKGTALDATSVEMKSLVLYINSLGGPKKETKKKPHFGC